jgi:hypothetical protein
VGTDRDPLLSRERRDGEEAISVRGTRAPAGRAGSDSPSTPASFWVCSSERPRVSLPTASSGATTLGSSG